MIRPPILNRPWKAVLMVLAATLGAGALPAAAGGQTAAPDEAAAVGLEGLFDTGLIFQDRNGDDVVDFVNAAIVLGAERSDSDLAAAVDIAARLGFETMAMDLPLARDTSDGSIGIVVGRGGVQRMGLTVPGLADLDSGAGLVTRTESGGRTWLIIAGADDAGTRVAAAALAARLPHVGTATGATLADVTADVEEYLADAGVVAQSVHVASVPPTATTVPLPRLMLSYLSLPRTSAQRRPHSSMCRPDATTPRRRTTMPATHPSCCRMPAPNTCAFR